MNESLATLQRAFSCLGHGSRLRIVLALLARPMFVTELAAEVELSQSCTTRHLQALAGAGLVLGRREGKRVVFDVDRDAPLFAALAALETVEVAGGAGLTSDRAPGRPPTRVEPVRVRRPGGRSGGRGIPARAVDRPPVQAGSAAPESSGPARAQELEDFLL